MEFTTIDKFNAYHKWLSEVLKNISVKIKVDSACHKTIDDWQEIRPPFITNCFGDQFEFFVGNNNGLIVVSDDCQTINDRKEEAERKNMIDVFLDYVSAICNINGVTMSAPNKDGEIELYIETDEKNLMHKLNAYINALDAISNVNL